MDDFFIKNKSIKGQIIPVTKPFLPPREEYESLLKEVWDRNWLTNDGPLVQQLEERLKDYLELSNLKYVSNGTIALQIAIKALGLRGEIITTPFSYVATTSSIVWEGCEPVFVDIDPETLNIDPLKIEAAITSKTTAILATHVFGNPCNIDAIQEIADRYELKVIYDAAHCFGTRYKGESVYNYGDISTASFHATKLFHTIEGGAVITNDAEVNQKISRMRNFGHAGPGNFEGVGINGKNSEFHAAMGLVNLNYIEEVLDSRKKQCELYKELLISAPLETIRVKELSTWNYSYYPIIFDSEEITLRIKAELEENGVYPRRYFYPSLDTLKYVKTEGVKKSKDISKRILCLPLFYELKRSEQEKVAELILQFSK